MEQKKEALSIQLPKLDGFDIFNVLLWIILLVPAVQLTNNSTFTFLRSILFIVWVAVFFIYVAIRIYREKRIFFYSATSGNLVVLLFGISVLLSLVLSASRLDSLYGYDMTFASSSLVLLAVVVFYFVIKIAGLSLEYAVSRLLSSLPITLAIIDIVACFAFLIPASVYGQVFGSYSTYISYLNANPLALLGALQPTLIVHLVALVIGGWQLANSFQKSKKLSPESIRRMITQFLLVIAASYLFFATVKVAFAGVVIGIVAAAVFAALLYMNKSKVTSNFAIVLVITALVASLLGVVWQKQGVVGTSAGNFIDATTTSSIITQSFLNTATPMWRQVVGFGTSTFPYLYMQYRPLDAAQKFGNTSYFYKPSSFAAETFVEHGGLGIVALCAIIAAIIWSFYKASSQKSVVLEISLLILLVAVLISMPSSLAVLVILFAVIAAYFDKIEALPELLPSIRALEIKESLYTNRSISRTNQLLVAASIASLIIALIAITPIALAVSGFSQAAQRIVTAQTLANKETKSAATTFSDAYTAASQAQAYCQKCPPLSYIKLSALLGIQTLYLNSIPEKEQATSQELRQVGNLLLQSITELLSKESSRYDVWFAIAQAYSGFASQEKATSFYVLAVQSMKNTLSLNPYSIDANYSYINLLFSLGNTAEINTEIQAHIDTLKQLVGTPIQVAFIDGVLLARNQKYTEAIAAFEKIKKDIAASTSLSETDKKQLTAAADQRITEVKTAQSQPKPTVTPSPTPSTTPRPTVSTTPTVTPTPSKAP